MKTACRLIAYYRVSTDKQGQSGLGMEAQRRLVESYAERSACEVVESYTEVESGKGKGVNRPQLVKALTHARKAKATLVIAKLDRLGRNVHFVSGLMESGIPFVAADSPDDEPFILHMKAAFGEEEVRKISQRTKAALAELKAKGVALGKPENLTRSAQAKGSKANRDQAVTEYASLLPKIRQAKADGLSLRAIAERLNQDGQTTRTGAEWLAMQVKRLLDRANR
jgi:DNA invertase Pin-like site-specific DNA recombinase